ncbi:hypothetical protein HPP92_005869 [Vanilla planifolia]|uniref:Peptidase S26 domain-containing protein n=1 Tax=Vanilla planifolia TaxID=51239 RepID=A0A835RHZ2_VANPL|nr:hypothetical protein HPP92_005869 [Vanilla planifolia]
MTTGRFYRFLHRVTVVPWRSIAGEALDRVLLVAKTVRGPSMLPTINITGDIVAVERISPRWSLITAGDIVLLRSPENPLKTVTKRVLALEGEAVTFVVDPAKGDVVHTVLVPKGHLWVQGDNIYESRDSRQFGPVPYGLIQGRAFCKVWPPENFGFFRQKM